MSTVKNFSNKMLSTAVRLICLTAVIVMLAISVNVTWKIAIRPTDQIVLIKTVSNGINVPAIEWKEQ